MKKTGLRFLKYALAGVLLLPSLSNLVFAEGESETGAGEGEAVTEKEETGETGGSTASSDAVRIKDISLTATDNVLTFVLPDGLEEDEYKDFYGTDHKLLIDVYKVADIVKDDKGYDAYSYAPVAGVDVKAATITTYEGLQKITREDWNAVAEEIAGQIDSLTPAKTAEYTSDKKAVADGLTVGLYLIVAHDKDNAALNDEGYSVANTALYEYNFLPQLVSLPTPKGKNIVDVDLTGKQWEVQDLDGDDPFGQYTIPTGEDEKFSDDVGIKSWMAGEEGWSKEMTVMLKPARKQRFGDLLIKKFIDVYENSSPVTFVFKVVAKNGDEVVYDNVASVSFTQPGEQQTLVKHIPVGATVTVTEIYKGAGYKLADGEVEEKTTTILAPNDKDAPASVRFANTYGEKIIRGYGIENTFTYGPDEETATGGGKWIHTKTNIQGKNGNSGSSDTNTSETGGEN